MDLSGTGYVVRFRGRGWRSPLSRRGDVKGEWDGRRTVVFASLQRQEQMWEQRCSHSLYLEELSFYSAELAMALFFLKNQGEES